MISVVGRGATFAFDRRKQKQTMVSSTYPEEDERKLRLESKGMNTSNLRKVWGIMFDSLSELELGTNCKERVTKGSGISSDQPKPSEMYGDLVTGIVYSLFLPVYVYLTWIETENKGAVNICLCFLWTTIMSWLSYYSRDQIFSFAACFGQNLTVSCMNLYQWPHAGEIVIVPQFFWLLVIAGANQAASAKLKAAMGILSAVTSLAIVIASPLGDVAEVGPSLFGGTFSFLLFLFYNEVQKDKGNESRNNSQLAFLILAGGFTYHVVSELTLMISMNGYALTGGFSILKAALLGAIGFVASGAFSHEIVKNENLSKLVQERAARLQIIGLAMEKSETAISITDSTSTVLYANDAMGSLVGCLPSNLERKRIVESLPVDDKVRSTLLESFKTESVETDVCLDKRTFRVTITPCPEDSTGGCSRQKYVVAFTDITEKRAREKAEKKAKDETLLARAQQESMEMLSHELRTPLQGIMGMASFLLSDKHLHPDSREPLSLIMASSRLLLTLINNMLDIRKCDAQMMDFVLSDEVVGPSILQAVGYCKPIASINGVNLVTDTVKTENVVVKINPLRLQQMVINLVANAIKYSPKNKNVVVQTSLTTLDKVEEEIDSAFASGPKQELPEGVQKRTKLALVISVKDEGPGIGDEGKKAMFKKFAQLDNQETRSVGYVSGAGQPSGTGLGLNLCLKFASKMNGNIWVKNNEETGSSFSFYFPVLTRPRRPSLFNQVPSTPVEDVAPIEVDTNPETNHQILVVDDTLINLKVLRRMLERIGYQSITTVESGDSALKELDKPDYDLVITDIQMPNMDGFELSKAINTRANKPIVVGLTAETSESLHEKAAANGMETILFKPITTAQMSQFLSSTLDAKDDSSYTIPDQ